MQSQLREHNKRIILRNLKIILILLATAMKPLSLLPLDDEKSIIISDTVKKNTGIFKRLAYKWVSTDKIINGKENKIQGVFTINLRQDSTFESLYKPGNFKKGSWGLINDSTFRLYLKLGDDFRILELTDSTLITKIVWETDDRIYKFRRK